MEPPYLKAFVIREVSRVAHPATAKREMTFFFSARGRSNPCLSTGSSITPATGEPDRRPAVIYHHSHHHMINNHRQNFIKNQITRDKPKPRSASPEYVIRHQTALPNTTPGEITRPPSGGVAPRLAPRSCRTTLWVSKHQQTVSICLFPIGFIIFFFLYMTTCHGSGSICL